MYSEKIVIITTPGTMKRDFVNTVQKVTAGKVALVVIQKPRKKSLIKRISIFYKKVGAWGIIPELFYAIQILTNKKIREVMNYTKLYTPEKRTSDVYSSKIIEIDDINSDYVYEQLQAIRPRLLLIWGGSILESRIITTAQNALNIHTGYCPYYRGTNCNIKAILNNDLKHVGITIHNVVPEVDAGAIQALVTVNTNQSPRLFFTELNNLAFDTYVQIAKSFIEGSCPEGTPQDISLGKNYLLKEWTYKKRYRVSKILLDLEEKFS